ncbi:UvrD-helicase domain-containing protein [Candidatus Saccharibacteria bacterium]|nr:UvrD-helicase domain-containing protein [Candidatus Saccharibacteria bacterium]
MPNKDYTHGLNQAQSEAVLKLDGPVLILAGAGSGKTKTLTHRVAHIIDSHQATPNEILAVTFTNKAAKEMRERVWQLVNNLAANSEPHRNFMPFMGTFHGVCVRILRRDGEAVGLPSSFVIFDETDRQQLIKQISKQLNLDEKQYPARTLAGIISNNKNELVSPAEFESIASGTMHEKAAKVYPIYEQELRKAGAVDFDDLIGLTVKLLHDHVEIRTRWQEQFKYVMIDEYQDTNSAQYKLVKLLLGSHQNICVVGDDWQSIYSWRGADFRNILNFENDYKNALVVKLEQNYRSTRHILDAAHAVITKNQDRSHKKLFTGLGDGSKVQLVQVRGDREEAEAIVRRVQSRVEMGVQKYSDFAVLYRTNAQSRSLEEQFVRHGLPYRIYGGVRFYDRKEIKDLLAYLRLIYQPEDRLSFERVINTPTRGIGTKSIENFLGWQVVSGLSLDEALSGAQNCDSLTPKARNSLTNFGEMLQALRLQAQDVSVSTLVDMLIRRIDYTGYVNDGSLQGQAREENIKELLSVAENYNELGLSGFLEEVALVSSNDEASGGANSVTLMTLHAAKGLEFPIVFLVGMEETVFPHSRAIYDASEMEEERRLCYVGMTRAKQELFLIYATSRMLYGNLSYNPPSRFIGDIPTEHLQSEASDSLDYQSSSLAFGDNPWEVTANINKSSEPVYVEEYQTGEVVEHQLFGRGTIMEVEGDNLAVYFKGKGVKKLNAAFAKLKRIQDA